MLLRLVFVVLCVPVLVAGCGASADVASQQGAPERARARPNVVPPSVRPRALTGGEVVLQVYAPALRQLRQRQVRVRALVPGARAAGGMHWPVRAGRFVAPPHPGMRVVTHGGWLFQRGARTLRWRECTLDTQRADVICTTPSGRRAVLSLDVRAMMIGAYAQGVDAGALTARLTRPGAEDLGAHLGVRPWAPGTLVGTYRVQAGGA